MSDPVLHQGDVVTCENGHEVCTVTADIFVETLNWGTHFGDWKQKEPTVGDRLPLWCAVCGAPYMAQTIERHGDWRDLGEGKSMGVAAMPVHAHIKGQGWVPPISEDMGPVPKRGELLDPS
jgi:hypothetical protein